MKPNGWKIVYSAPILYSGPDTPTAYDPNWQLFTNLTKDQIAWFQAQPEWASFTQYVALDPPSATINANVSSSQIAAALAASALSAKLNVP